MLAIVGAAIAIIALAGRAVGAGATGRVAEPAPETTTARRQTLTERAHSAEFRDLVGAELADVVSRLRRAMRRAARAADPGGALSVAQLELLSCLAEHPGARPGQLAGLLRLAPSSVTTLINGLRSAGFVIRADGDDDRRTARLDLSGAGMTAVARWQSVNEDLVDAALGTLSPASQTALRGALPALRELAGAVNALADDPHAAPAPAPRMP